MKFVLIIFICLACCNISISEILKENNPYARVQDSISINKLKLSFGVGKLFFQTPSDLEKAYSLELLITAKTKVGFGCGLNLYSSPNYDRFTGSLDLLFLYNFFLPFKTKVVETYIGLGAEFFFIQIQAIGIVRVDFNIKKNLSIGFNYKRSDSGNAKYNLLKLNLSFNFF